MLQQKYGWRQWEWNQVKRGKRVGTAQPTRGVWATHPQHPHTPQLRAALIGAAPCGNPPQRGSRMGGSHVLRMEGGSQLVLRGTAWHGSSEQM